MGGVSRVRRGMLGVVLGVLGVLGMVASGGAQVPEVPTKNVEVLGHIEPITTAEAGGLHNSVWGYAAPDGHEYAFLGTYVGTYVIDLESDPIREVAFIPGPHSTWRNIKTYGTVAYIANENRRTEEGAGLQIVDLSALPDSVHLVRTDTTLMLSAHTLWVEGDRLYAYGTRAEVGVNGGALILDLAADPLNPVRIGGVAERYYHDGFVRNDTLVGAAINEGGADIVDVADPQNPRVIGRIAYPYAGTHNTALTADGRYAITSDEVNFTPKTMKVWDIGDPDDIVLVAEFSPNLEETIHNVRIRDRYAFVAWYTAGVRIIDMVDPRHPREVGFADTYGGRDGGFNGVWEVYPWLPSGRIIASDRNSGLWLLRFNGAVAGSLSGRILDAAGGVPLDSALITPTDDTPLPSRPDGSYYLGGVVGEEISFRVSRFGYRDTTITLVLTEESRLDIRLSPLPFSPVTFTVLDAERREPVERFAWAIDGVVDSRIAPESSVTVELPEGVDFRLIVGRWGDRMVREVLRSGSPADTVVILLERGYQDDFTLDLGWQRGVEGDGATSGIWNRIETYLGYPRSDWIHPENEPNGTPGWIYFTGRPPLFAPPELDDVSGGATTLLSPAIDLRGSQDPMIVFDRWFVHFEKDTLLDAFTVDLSDDGGATWTEAWREVKGKSGWRPIVIFPASHITLTDRVHLRIRVSDHLGNTLVASGIDNFEILDRTISDVEEEEGEMWELDLSVGGERPTRP